jgi:hypothetical protein
MRSNNIHELCGFGDDRQRSALGAPRIFVSTYCRMDEAIHNTVFREGLIELNSGAGGRNRTDTLSPEQDFESSASTSSATPAYRRREFPRALHLFCT